MLVPILNLETHFPRSGLGPKGGLARLRAGDVRVEATLKGDTWAPECWGQPPPPPPSRKGSGDTVPHWPGPGPHRPLPQLQSSDFPGQSLSVQP